MICFSHGIVSTKGPSSSEDELNAYGANEKLNAHHFVDSKQALDIMNCKQINNAKVKSTGAVNKQTKQQKCSNTGAQRTTFKPQTNTRVPDRSSMIQWLFLYI